MNGRTSRLLRREANTMAARLKVPGSLTRRYMKKVWYNMPWKERHAFRRYLERKQEREIAKQWAEGKR